MSLVENSQAPDFLKVSEDQTTSANIIADIKNKVAKMRQLEQAMIVAENAAEIARQEYEKYKATVVVAAMISAGVTQLQDEQGNFVRLDSKYYCNPNKNDDDRLKLEEWLKKHGGEHLVKRQGIVAEEQLGVLDEAGIPHAEKLDVNTNSLKSFIMDQLGLKKGSTQRISLDDIPDFVHFYSVQEVVTG